MQLVSKISNLCSRDPPTSQTDGRIDDMQSPYRALHYSASRGKNDVTGRMVYKMFLMDENFVSGLIRTLKYEKNP